MVTLILFVYPSPVIRPFVSVCLFYPQGVGAAGPRERAGNGLRKTFASTNYHSGLRWKGRLALQHNRL